MTDIGPASDVADGPAERERDVRDRIATLSYLPTAAAVAVKFIELGKDPDAEPEDYARVIEADSSLATKILALANSAWFGVRHQITTVKQAVTHLGLKTVRRLAISYCVAGLHNELGIKPYESKVFWEASLYKALAAKEYVETSPKLSDEAFACGLFEDFSMMVMYAVAAKDFAPLIEGGGPEHELLLAQERDLFVLDHTEFGRMLAAKLALPELFVDAVGFHHNYASLRGALDSEVLADAVYVASLFPHTLSAWNSADRRELASFFQERGRGSLPDFLRRVVEAFKVAFAFFDGGEAPEASLTELMQDAAREVADQTTRLVGTVNEVMA